VFSVWDGDWALLEEYGTENTLLESYVQGLHGLVKTVISNIYYYQDSLGSTSHIADASGQLLESYRYDLYGAPKYFAADGTPLPNGSGYGVRDLFAGQRWMPELGLYDDRNRFMSPDLGRFLQPDPIGFKGDGSNLYRYCGNDWANRTDPMGLGPNITDNEAGTMEDYQGINGAHQGGASQQNASNQLRFTASAATAMTVERAGGNTTYAASGGGWGIAIGATLREMGAHVDPNSTPRRSDKATDLSDGRLGSALENNRTRINRDNVAKKDETDYAAYQYRNNSSKFEFYHRGQWNYEGSIAALHGTWNSHEINYFVIGEAAAAHHESLRAMDRLIALHIAQRELRGGAGRQGGEGLWARAGYAYYHWAQTLEGGY